MSDISLNTAPRRSTPTTIYEDAGSLVQYDGRFFSGQNTTFPTTTSASMSGYEALTIKYAAEDTGSTTYKKFEFDDGDGNLRNYGGSRSFITTYNNITLKGKPDSRTRVRSAFVPYLTGYDSNGTPTITTIGDVSGTVEIFERWPTARMYASGDNDNGTELYDESRIVFGYEPMYVTFTDSSVARTFPISDWFIDFGDGSSIGWGTPDPNFHPANSIVTHESIFFNTYTRANTYYATLYNVASSSGTRSAEVFKTADELETETLNESVTCRIDVYPLRHSNNFFLISGASVSSTYTADSPTNISEVTTNGGTFISGYAPNLTVTFQESCTPISFPISSYDWNFGDVFTGLSSYNTVCATNVQTGFGAGWITDKTNHYVTYTYKFPGIYNVTLDSEVSSDPTYKPAFQYSLSASVCAKNLLVYVEEIYPEASFEVAYVSGGPYTDTIVFTGTPMTVWFNASSTVAGSFEIGRLIYDFGDGTIETFNIDDYSAPLQNLAVSHEYTRTATSQPSTFNVSMSAFAYNTDSYDTYQITGLGPLAVLPTSAVEDIDIPMHLLATTIGDNDNLMLVLEGQNKSTFNYILTSGLLT